MKIFILYAGLLIFVHSIGLFAQNVLKSSIQPAEPSPGAAEQVIINGIALSAQQLTEMEQAYGVKLLPGNYWYDTYSGLYGQLDTRPSALCSQGMILEN